MKGHSEHTMIIYGDSKELLSCNAGISRIERLINRPDIERASDHDSASELLISMGEFEAAMMDYLCPESDSINDLIILLRGMSIASGHIFINSLKRHTSEIGKWIAVFKAKLAALKNYSISSLLTYNLPEGYAFYSLYPEMYLKSADNFYHTFFPLEASVIGIRSIGTSLSAVVSARLEELGCKVHSYTVRPGGFYFDRELIIDMELEEDLKAAHKGYYLIVDEGPGLSGSSFASVAEKLESLGISEERIIFFPAYRTDGQNFVSEKSKTIWTKHRKFVSEFEDVISVKDFFPGLSEGVKDVSAGMWRGVLFNNDEDFPPVYSSFEQRKYLSADNKYMIKFAGLGHYGRELYERARVLAGEGFSPEALGFENGFILSRFVEGKALSASGIGRDFLNRAASYIAFLKRAFPAICSRSYNEIEEMTSVNLMKGLGDEWAEKFRKMSRGFESLFSTDATAVDGRMLPWEWLNVKGTYVKTDSIHHHKDHFFPGCQDAAYDIAGFLSEFSLGQEEEDYFIKHYINESGDKEIESRLPFYYIFYNAFRLGMTLFPIPLITDNKEKERFQILSQKYARNLKRSLEI